MHKKNRILDPVFFVHEKGYQNQLPEISITLSTTVTISS